MSYYSNNITRLCELAFQAYAKQIGLANIPVSKIIAGFDDENVPGPRLVFNCDNAEPEGPFDDANWSCHLEIQCATNCDDKSAVQHHAFSSEVFSQFFIGRYTIPDTITAAAASAVPYIPFICWDIMTGRQAKSIHERHWISSLELMVKCCGGPIAEDLLSEGGLNLLSEEGRELTVEG